MAAAAASAATTLVVPLAGDSFNYPQQTFTLMKNSEGRGVVEIDLKYTDKTGTTLSLSPASQTLSSKKIKKLTWQQTSQERITLEAHFQFRYGKISIDGVTHQVIDRVDCCKWSMEGARNIGVDAELSISFVDTQTLDVSCDVILTGKLSGLKFPRSWRFHADGKGIFKDL